MNKILADYDKYQEEVAVVTIKKSDIYLKEGGQEGSAGETLNQMETVGMVFILGQGFQDLR